MYQMARRGKISTYGSITKDNKGKSKMKIRREKERKAGSFNFLKLFTRC